MLQVSRSKRRRARKRAQWLLGALVQAANPAPCVEAVALLRAEQINARHMDPHGEPDTLLFCAARVGFRGVNTAHALLDRGADPTLCTRRRLTSRPPLQHVCSTLVKASLVHGSEIDYARVLALASRMMHLGADPDLHTDSTLLGQSYGRRKALADVAALYAHVWRLRCASMECVLACLTSPLVRLIAALAFAPAHV